jgi:hypothetical protein
VGSENGDRNEANCTTFSLASSDVTLPLPYALLLLLIAHREQKSSNRNRNCKRAGTHAREREDMSKSYVIEVGEDQAGLVIREDGESEYLFHAAHNGYSALEGRRFANALLAERAAIRHSASRRGLRSVGAFGR